MFESLSDRLGAVVGRLRNRGRLTDGDVDEVLGEIGRASCRERVFEAV